MPLAVRNEDRAEYRAIPTVAPDRADEDEAIRYAMNLLRNRLMHTRIVGSSLSSPTDVKNYLTLCLADREHEVFTCLFLDAQNRLIADEEMFRGTLTQTSVYPREIVKAALQHNAAAVVFAHNHPSGIADPSRADTALTAVLKNALALVDVKVLDHIIIGQMATTSFAESGLI
jgi:DNA repair protein RadC